MSSLGDHRMIAAPAAMAAATGFRIGLVWMQVWASHSPTLVELGMDAWKPETDPDRAAKAYREEFMATYKQSVKAALGQVQRGVGDTESYLDGTPLQSPSRSTGLFKPGT